MPSSKIIDAHICRGKVMRKYPTILCSCCRTGESVDIALPESEIDNYNKKDKEIADTKVHDKDTR